MHTPIHWWLRNRVPHECVLISIFEPLTMEMCFHCCKIAIHASFGITICLSGSVFVIWDTLLRSCMYWVSILMSVCDMIAVVLTLLLLLLVVQILFYCSNLGLFQSKFVSHSCLYSALVGPWISKLWPNLFTWSCQSWIIRRHALLLVGIKLWHFLSPFSESDYGR